MFLFLQHKSKTSNIYCDSRYRSELKYLFEDTLFILNRIRNKMKLEVLSIINLKMGVKFILYIYYE
jgi:hypothetical protein